MSDSLPPSPQLAPAERLLSSLPGIVSARIVATPGGHFEEIHILATAELHPKQIVRNIESALSAGLGIEVNRRIVSVAQLREGAVEGLTAAGPTPLPSVEPSSELGATPPSTPGAEPSAAPGAEQSPALGVAPLPVPASVPAAPTNTIPAPPLRNGAQRAAVARVVYLGHEVIVDASRTATCTVAFRAGEEEFSGQGQGFDSPQGRAEAAARAVVAALQGSGTANRFGLEGVAIVDEHGRECVLVAIRSLEGRRRTSLTGVAPLRDSPEEAAILAALHATNHWRSR